MGSPAHAGIDRDTPYEQDCKLISTVPPPTRG